MSFKQAYKLLIVNWIKITKSEEMVVQLLHKLAKHVDTDKDRWYVGEQGKGWKMRICKVSQLYKIFHSPIEILSHDYDVAWHTHWQWWHAPLLTPHLTTTTTPWMTDKWTTYPAVGPTNVHPIIDCGHVVYIFMHGCTVTSSQMRPTHWAQWFRP